MGGTCKSADRGRGKGRATHTQTQTQTHRHRHTDTDTQTHRHRHTDTHADLLGVGEQGKLVVEPIVFELRSFWELAARQLHGYLHVVRVQVRPILCSSGGREKKGRGGGQSGRQDGGVVMIQGPKEKRRDKKKSPPQGSESVVRLTGIPPYSGYHCAPLVTPSLKYSPARH